MIDLDERKEHGQETVGLRRVNNPSILADLVYWALTGCVNAEVCAAQCVQLSREFMGHHHLRDRPVRHHRFIVAGPIRHD